MDRKLKGSKFIVGLLISVVLLVAASVFPQVEGSGWWWFISGLVGLLLTYIVLVAEDKV